MKSSKTHRRASVWAVSVIILTVLFGFVKKSDYFEIAKNLDIFATLFKEVNTYYVDEVEPEDLMTTGIEAMLNSLDPYTNFIPEEDIADYRTMTTGEYAGIGSLIANINGKNVVTMPNKGFPADKAGLKIGDELIEVNGINVEKKTTAEISKLLKGKAKTKVDLTIRRFGEDEDLKFTIARGRIIVNNVAYYGMLNDDIGFIKLTDFTTDAGKEVRNALMDLRSKDAQGIVLDLRGNPGGLLHEAVNICNLFLPKGTEIVSTRGKIREWNKVYRALNNPVDLEIPLAVLTNGGSASASEIVAGVMQDYDRGIVVGRKSFGKGLVQVTRPLTYNTQLKVTTAKYYTPSGRCIQSKDYSSKNGNGQVSDIPDSLKTIFKTTNGRDVLDGGGVEPDFVVKSEVLSPVTISLLTKGLIFDYATEYFYNHHKIDQARSFRLSNAEYQEFIEWLDRKDYSYETEVEKNLTGLIKNSKENGLFADIEQEIADLKQQIQSDKQSDLMTNKEQIQSLLEESIVARFYLMEGEIEASFSSDEDLRKAVEVLSSDQQYSNTLKAAGQ